MVAQWIQLLHVHLKMKEEYDNKENPKKNQEANVRILNIYYLMIKQYMSM